jgi:TetR/AcrR family transcriptional regulator
MQATRTAMSDFEDVPPTIAGDLPRSVTRKRPKPGERRVQILQALAEPCWSSRVRAHHHRCAGGSPEVSEAALYRHFASKAQMFEGLIEFIEQTVFSLVNQITNASRRRAMASSRWPAAIVAMLLQFGEKNPAWCA